MVGTDHPAAGAIEQAVLGRQHDYRRRTETLILLDQRASLIAIQPRHDNVAENHFRLMVGNHRQRIETVFGKQYLTTSLHQKYFRATADGVAVVDDHYLDALQTSDFSQFFPPGGCAVSSVRGLRQ